MNTQTSKKQGAMKAIRIIAFLSAVLFFTACSTSKNSKQQVLKTSSIRPLSTPTSFVEHSAVKDQYLHGYYAQELNISPDQIKNIDLYRLIDDWMGAPYRLGGQSKTGIDCSALTALVYKNIYRLQIPRTTTEQYGVTHKKPLGKLKEGDLVFLNYEGKKNSHVGIYLGNGRFFHASTSSGVMISDLNQPWYGSRYSAGGELTLGNN